MPTLTQITAALVTLVDTIPEFKQVLDYEPQAIQVSPLATVTTVSYERNQSGQITAMIYRTRVRIYVKWQENASAEAEAVVLVDKVCDAIDSDPQFGGVISAGLAQSPDGTGGYINVGGALVRIWDVFVRIVSKKPFLGAI